MTSLAPPAKAVPQGQGITSAILILSNLVPLAGILFWAGRLSLLPVLGKPPSLGSGPARAATMSRVRIHSDIAASLRSGLRACRMFMSVHMFSSIRCSRAMEWAFTMRGFIRLIVIGKDLWMPLLARSSVRAIFVNDAVNRFVFAKAHKPADTARLWAAFTSASTIMHLAIRRRVHTGDRAAPLIVLVYQDRDRDQISDEQNPSPRLR